ncbi:Phosphoribosylaminoimidazolesuccinocarboxamide synthase [Providencia stuartii]|nr:hypothetical protein DR96_426 [Providencia stuartii]SST04255.1 Uncharacterised protein [Acinetobacter baumannii]CAK6616586.1 Phosphoribosylaminoimidazolesuccinocarboxamide synthase [Providencia stuartii]CAK6618186.1 Phosphoribosylaminoimidazolesuccinocarboxamide synthase [Providencia stuartii]SPY68851.1 Uncharacterised protein [Providencia stuartii]
MFMLNKKRIYIQDGCSNKDVFTVRENKREA